jgi:hypothetical protein
MAFIIPYAILYTGIYSGITGIVSSATKKTCENAASLYNFKNPNVRKLLKKTDIENKLSIIGSLIQKYCENNNINNDSEYIDGFKIIDNEKNPVHLCIESIIDVFNNINATLLKIKEKINYHETRYFNNWIKLDIKQLLDELDMQIIILDKRFDYFIKLSACKY